MTAANTRLQWRTAGVVFLTGLALVVIARGVYWLKSSTPDAAKSIEEVAEAPPASNPIVDSKVVPAVGIMPALPSVEIVSPTVQVTTPPMIEVLPPPRTERVADATKPPVTPVAPPLLDLPAAAPPESLPVSPAPIQLKAPRSEPPIIDAPKLDVPKIDLPKPSLGIELPTPGPVKVEAPKKPVLKYDLPSVEAPKIDLPGPTAASLPTPSLDLPKQDAPGINVPKPALKYDLPSVEAPKIDLPAPAAPSLPKPGIELPKIDFPSPAISVPIRNPQSADSSRSASPAKSAELPSPLPIPSTDFRLQPLESGHNVKLRENSSATVKNDSLIPLPSADLTAATGEPTTPASTPLTAPTTMPTGAATMSPALRPLILSAVIGSALIAGPANAQDNQADDKKAGGLGIPASVVSKDDIDNLRKDMLALKILLEGKTDKGISSDGLLQKVERLEDTLRGIERRLSDLEKAATNRIAGSSPVGTSPTPTLNTVGTVTVVNMYPTEISIVINERSHRVEPNEKKSIVVPAGTFKYMLLGGTGSEIVRDIKPTETVTLWVK